MVSLRKSKSNPKIVTGIPDVFNNMETVRQIRGIVVDMAIEVEHYIDLVLSEYFSPEVIRNEKFRSLLLQREFFTTGMKVQTLDTLGLHRNKRYGKTFQGLIGDLMYIIGVRNSLAHRLGDPAKSEFILKLVGGDRSVKLDENFMSEFVNVSRLARDKLKALHADMVIQKG